MACQMNLKVGMDDQEYDNYVSGSIIPLFPDLKDVQGKLVVLKIDSGPCYLKPDLLTSLWLISVYKYPRVPNTTDVTQEMDNNYGPSKITFKNNLDYITQQRVNSNHPCSLKIYFTWSIILEGQSHF